MLWSEEVWEQPAGGAGTERPQAEWQAGLGKQRRQWGETDLQANTKVWSFTRWFHYMYRNAWRCLVCRCISATAYMTHVEISAVNVQYFL